MTSPRDGVRTLTFTGDLCEDDRVVLRDRLGAVFCDESAPRPGWSWLAPDRRVTVTAGDQPGEWRLHIWVVDDMGTEQEWVDERVAAAFEATSLTLQGDSTAA